MLGEGDVGKELRGQAQNQSEWTWRIYAAACPILFFPFLSASISSFFPLFRFLFFLFKPFVLSWAYVQAAIWPEKCWGW